MTEHPYEPQPWRLTEYYPEAYARFMDVLNVGVLPDWNDHGRHEAEFLADLAAHDAELREQIAAEIAAEIDEPDVPHPNVPGWNAAMLTAARIARGATTEENER